MTRSLVWKEVREQWAVWLAVAAAAAACVAVLLAIRAPGLDRATTLIPVLWFAAWGYGLLCGSLLLAGECEDDTQTFLDMLPATRDRLWRVKAATGLGLLAAQMAAILVMAGVIVRHDYLSSRVVADLFGILYFGGLGLAWGLFSGSFSTNVLRAIGWAVLLQVVLGVVLLPGSMIVLQTVSWSQLTHDEVTVWLVAMATLAAAATARSRSVYCRPDQMRASAAVPRAEAPVQRSWEVLFWLAWRQTRGFALGMAAFALFGIIAVVFLRALAWQALTLFIGILCGVTTFADEQESGAFRFAGDQRFPLGRVWLVKTLVRLAVGFGAAAIIALGVGLTLAFAIATTTREQQINLDNQFQSGLISTLWWLEPRLFFSLWLVYGYAVGVLSGLLFRKPLVAGVVAVGVAAPLAAVWMPSVFVSAGLSAWQVFGIPAVLLVAARSLMRPWAGDRLFSARPVVVTLTACVVAAAWLAAALWCRVTEIPAARDAVDVDAFVASLPTPEQNVAGRLTATSLRRVAEIRRNFVSDEPAVPVRPQAAGQRPTLTVPTFDTYTNLAYEVAENGWKTDDRRLRKFLGRVFAVEWARELFRAADEPSGVTFDPRNPASTPVLPDLIASGDIGLLLVARGLQQQQDGNPEEYLGYLRAGLALARNMRHRTIFLSVNGSVQRESRALTGLERWLERLDGRPDLLRRALAELTRHAEEPPIDLEDARAAEYLVALNRFSDPRALINIDNRNNLFSLGAVESVDFLQFALQVPWEKARVRRLLDGFASHDRTLHREANSFRPRLIQIAGNPLNSLEFNGPRLLTARVRSAVPAARLQVALRLYQAENGKPAEKLQDLVPEYLPAVPKDPSDDQPFRYRVSAGETLNWPPADFSSRDGTGASPVRKVPAGQGILWCVGENKTDDGGHTQESPHSPGEVPGEDVIYLVPLPPGQK
jgi:hypothetical protein